MTSPPVISNSFIQLFFREGTVPPMMPDLSAFSKDNFDPKVWLNNTFDAPEAKENKEEYAAALVTKLQSFIQEVSLSLEKTAEQVIQNIPRVAREVDAMRQEALVLQEEMNSVKDDVMKVERDSSESMHTLLQIDHVKSCMQEASKALREADNWSTLSANVEEVFESGDINAISSKLIGMQNSLEILVDVPDYSERSQRLEALKDKLEAIVSPQLIAAFNSQANVADIALVYMKIFKDIKRLHRFQKYYHNFQKNLLLQQWKQVVEADSEDTLTVWLNSFYDILLSTWQSQFSICGQLLPDIPPIEVLSELIVDTLVNLDPSLQFCIEATLKLQNDHIQYLIDLKQITDRLAKTIDSSIQAHDHSFLRENHVIVLAQTIYSPYRPHIEQYATLEEKRLVTSLNTLKFQSEELMDSVRLLGDSVSKVFFFVQEADHRCHQLTYGCAYSALFEALKGFFNEYLDKFGKVQSQLKCAAQDSSKTLGSDWITFQQSLQCVQTMGEVLLQLERLEQLLKSNTREIGRKLSYYTIVEENADDIKNPFHAYDDILLSHSLKRELKQAITNIQEDSQFHPLGETLLKYKKMCSAIGCVVVDSIRCQIRTHFQQLPLLKVWTEESSSLAHLPASVMSPLEYITEVGQFLMTIPQHIEPFILQDNPALYVALKNFKSPSASQQDSIGNVADYLLECLANGISEAYLESLLKIPHLTSSATNQLITDIGYYCDVLDDLGLTASLDIVSLLLLLKSKPEDYSKTTEDKPLRLVNVVKTMRKIR